MRSIACADFLIGVCILFVLEGILFAASPAWMRRAMKSALATPDNILRVVGIGSAGAGLIFIWGGRREHASELHLPCVQKDCGINVIVSGCRPFFAGMLSSNACAATPFGRTVAFKFRPVFKKRD